MTNRPNPSLAAVLLAAFLLLLTVRPARAQERPEPSRPKIGLVLGGGGARGFAHIGVLEWLEENRIPVDYVGGTSMGGLVGAMYSIGMSPAEMRDLTRDLDWPRILNGSPPYEDLTVRGKADRRALPGGLEFGLKGGFRTPSGVNAGHALGLVFSRVSLPYSTSLDFDTLPIPLRVVATDIVQGEQVVIGSGPLDRALRATMAIPGLFSPIEREGRPLVDGTLVNNVPTDVVKAMGADIVIVVDVSGGLGDARSLDSIFGVLRQSLSIMGLAKTRENTAPAPDRVILRPDLDGFTFADFPLANDIADRGYASVKDRGEAVRGLSLDEAAWNRYREERQRRAQARRAVVTPEYLEVTGVSGPAAAVIRRDLSSYVGAPLTAQNVKSLEEKLTRYSGTGRFDRLSYETVRSERGTGLRVLVDPKTYGPPFLLAGLEIDGTDADRIELNLRARLLQFDVLGYGSEWRTDVGFGTRQMIGTELIAPLGGKPLSGVGWFVAPRASISRDITNVYRDEQRVAEYRVRQASVGLDVGRTLDRRSEVRLGYDYGSVNATIRVGDPLLPSLKGQVGVLSLRFQHDGQDSPTVPTRGLYVESRGAWYFESPGAEDAFPLAEGTASFYSPVRERGSVFAGLSGGTTFYASAPPAQEFTLGGPLRLGAYGRDEFRGSHYVLARTGYLHRLRQLSPLLGTGVWVGGWYEFGDVFDRLEAARYRSSVSAGILADTRLGPLFIGGSLGEGGRRALYFSIGRVL